MKANQSGMVRASQGNIKALHITPRDEITGAWPDCTLCTWVAVGNGVMRLKYLSQACQAHGNVERD
jgi:hypothetical protein